MLDVQGRRIGQLPELCGGQSDTRKARVLEGTMKVDDVTLQEECSCIGDDIDDTEHAFIPVIGPGNSYYNTSGRLNLGGFIFGNETLGSLTLGSFTLGRERSSPEDQLLSQ